jgi:hypothetical protein
MISGELYKVTDKQNNFFIICYYQDVFDCPSGDLVQAHIIIENIHIPHFYSTEKGDYINITLFVGGCTIEPFDIIELPMHIGETISPLFDLVLKGKKLKFTSSQHHRGKL